MNYFDLVEIEINEDRKKINELIESYNNIKEQIDLLIKIKSVYDKTSDLIFSKISSDYSNDSNNSKNLFKNNINNIDSEILTPTCYIVGSQINEKNINLLDENSNSEFNFVSEVIKTEDDMKFKRIIFRASRSRAIPTFLYLTIENLALQIVKNY